MWRGASYAYSSCVDARERWRSPPRRRTDEGPTGRCQRTGATCQRWPKRPSSARARASPRRRRSSSSSSIASGRALRRAQRGVAVPSSSLSPGRSRELRTAASSHSAVCHSCPASGRGDGVGGRRASISTAATPRRLRLFPEQLCAAWLSAARAALTRARLLRPPARAQPRSKGCKRRSAQNAQRRAMNCNATP